MYKFLFVYLLYSVCCRSSGGSGSHGGVVFVVCELVRSSKSGFFGVRDD